MTPTSGNEALEKAIDHAISCFKGTKEHCIGNKASVLMRKEFFYVTESYIESFSEKQEHLPSTLPL